ncbi:MAG: DMT family transporter [Candidatus Planktophila sp.]|nr:DMT family transporter [Candidatus Planktophila sp.]
MKVSRLAPYIFVLLWSTGFVGAKYGLPYADPFIFLALRLFIAALILFGIAVLLKSPIALTRIQIRSSSLIGIFLHAAYLGGVFFAISRGVSAGTAAVITSLQPVLVSVLAIKILNEKLRGKQILGLILGLCGVVLVLGPSFESSVSRMGILAVFIALIGSTTATLLQKKIGSGIPLLAGTAYQYCASGFFLFITAVVTGGTEIQWNIRFTSAMIWLILILSVGAILLLLWLLNTASAASVSSLFYLVPPATAIEAYFLFGEKLNTQSLVGVAITAIGVWCVVRVGN